MEIKIEFGEMSYSDGEPWIFFKVKGDENKGRFGIIRFNCSPSKGWYKSNAPCNPLMEQKHGAEVFDQAIAEANKRWPNGS